MKFYLNFAYGCPGTGDPAPRRRDRPVRRLMNAGQAGPLCSQPAPINVTRVDARRAPHVRGAWSRSNKDDPSSCSPTCTPTALPLTPLDR